MNQTTPMPRKPKSIQDDMAIAKGGDWRKFAAKMPHDRMRALGTVKVGVLEGALVLDMRDGVFKLMNSSGWWDLDGDKVRAALDAIQ